MNVLLDIPEETLKHYSRISKIQKQSRKAMMEMVLIQHVQNVNYDSPMLYLPVHKIKKEKPKPLLDGAFIENKVEVQDLTKENAIGKVYDPFKNKRFTDKNKVHLK